MYSYLLYGQSCYYRERIRAWYWKFGISKIEIGARLIKFHFKNGEKSCYQKGKNPLFEFGNKFVYIFVKKPILNDRRNCF